MLDHTDGQLLTVFSAALVFLPLTVETALQHWNIIGAEHGFVALLRKLELLAYVEARKIHATLKANGPIAKQLKHA